MTKRIIFIQKSRKVNAIIVTDDYLCYKQSPDFHANACFYISQLHFSNFADICKYLHFFHACLHILAFWGEISCIMLILNIFRFNSMYFDFYIAYCHFSGFSAYITLTCITVPFIEVFSYVCVVCSNAKPLHYYALRVPRKVDRWH